MSVPVCRELPVTTGHPWFLWLRAREAHGTGQGTVCGSSLGSASGRGSGAGPHGTSSHCCSLCSSAVWPPPWDTEPRPGTQPPPTPTGVQALLCPVTKEEAHRQDGERCKPAVGVSVGPVCGLGQGGRALHPARLPGEGRGWSTQLGRHRAAGSRSHRVWAGHRHRRGCEGLGCQRAPGTASRCENKGRGASEAGRGSCRSRLGRKLRPGTGKGPAL